MMRRTLWGRTLVTILVVAVMAGAQEPVTVRQVAGSPVSGKLLGIAPDGALQIQTPAGVEAVAQAAIVSATLSRVSLAAPRGAVLVDLASGDRVVARIEGGNFDEVSLGTVAAGTFKLFLDHVVGVRWLDVSSPALDLPDAVGEEDELFVRAGDGLDRLPGEMMRLDRAGVVFDSAAGKERLFSSVKDRVCAVRLAAVDPFEEPDSLYCVAVFRDGTRLSGVLRSGSSGAVRMKLTVGPEVTLDVRMLSSLTFRNGSFRYLSDFEPEKLVEVPYLEGGPRYGLVRDRGFGQGMRLRIGGQSYDKGIGLHARSSCTFALGGAFSLFQAEVGVDPITKDRPIPGSVRVRVLADAQEIWKSGQLVAGDDPIPVRVSGLAGASQLVIEIEFASSLGTGARAVFGEAMVLKE